LFFFFFELFKNFNLNRSYFSVAHNRIEKIGGDNFYVKKRGKLDFPSDSYIPPDFEYTYLRNLQSSITDFSSDSFYSHKNENQISPSGNDQKSPFSDQCLSTVGFSSDSTLSQIDNDCNPSFECSSESLEILDSVLLNLLFIFLQYFLYFVSFIQKYLHFIIFFK
jgi:hypothetical protein